MNLTGFVVSIGITITAGVVTWNFIISPKENLQEHVNTNETTSTSKIPTEAWIIYNGIENGTVIVFNPANKSVSRQQFLMLDAEIYILASAQNDNLGVILGYNDPQAADNIYTFDKQRQKIIKSKNMDYHLDEEVGISDVNAVTFTMPTTSECQKLTMMSTQDNGDVQSDIATKTCRKLPYCIASMNSGDIFIFGGLSTTSQHMLGSEKYSAELGSFVAVADFPVFLNQNYEYPSHCITTEFLENVFVCDNNIFNNQSCFIYHTDSDAWEAVGGFISDRSNYVLIVLGGDLFAIGGNQMKSIERYIPEQRVWEVFITNVEDIQTSNNELIGFSVYK